MTFDWPPTLLAAAGTSPSVEYPSDGEDILPVVEGTAPMHPRTLFWRYKAQGQRAVRDGDWKYLKIKDNEYLFDVVIDQRERANLKERHPEVFQRLRRVWQEWDAHFLPITDEVFSGGLTPETQADRYVPDAPMRLN